MNAGLQVDPYRTAEIQSRILGSATIGTLGGGHELQFAALGTRCRVNFVAPPGRVRTTADAVVNWVGAFEAKYSRFLPTSLVSQINAAAGTDWTPLDPEADRLFALCDQLHFLTRGILEPTALPLIRLWDWKTGRVPTDAEIERARGLVGWRLVERAPGRIRLPRGGMAVDLGGMGKEYAVDQILALLAQHGVSSALVDFGADIRVAGPPPDGRPAWFIGLDDPVNPGTAWTGLAVRDVAVASSGDYIRKFEISGRRYGHILDPRTGRPVANGVRAVSVVAPSCTQAGMLSTAACVLGAVEGLRLLESAPGISGAIVTETGTVTTKRFYEYVPS